MATHIKDLAQGMARLAHVIRNAAMDIRQEQADMVVQSLVYGIFTAYVLQKNSGIKECASSTAQNLIAKFNPFLRHFFSQITGLQLDQAPWIGFVNDLISFLDHTNTTAVLEEFGKTDPIMHFYEAFLAEYDPSLRAKRGVYYTPEPVVSYIVRSVDFLLKTKFQCQEGLADPSMIPWHPQENPISQTKQTNQSESAIVGQETLSSSQLIHKVLLLDPAVGTGTFLYSVIAHIREQFMQKRNAGLWNGYAKQHLFPRLFGFELLMAPYAVAHCKLSLQLAGWDLPDALRDQYAYSPTGEERLGLYLTNALEEHQQTSDMPLFIRWLSEETQAANQVKCDLPVLVVIGNPPYSGHSANRNTWINNLLKGKLPNGSKTSSYYEVDGKPLGEKNPKWLQDDYVKFIRFAQHRIEQTGQGIVAFITNHGYLDNPTFRGMRQSLMQTFSQIYILNLHGNVKKQETCPDGQKDENVFDIQQGVAIGIFIKEPGKTNIAQVVYADIWGRQEQKYEQLLAQTLETTVWKSIQPQSPYYFFVPQNTELLQEYQQGWKVSDIFPINSVGIVTARDNLTIHFTRDEVWKTVQQFIQLSPDDARTQFDLGKDARDWKVHLAQEDVRKTGPKQENLVQILYRPFDVRHTYYTGKENGFICRPRRGIMQHFLHQENVGLITARQQSQSTLWSLVCVTAMVTESSVISNKTREINTIFPLYLYPPKIQGRKSVCQIKAFDTHWAPDHKHADRIPNLDPTIVAAMSQKLGLPFDAHKTDDCASTFGTEDIFHYVYAILHHPTYRTRYAEFLKSDFPRIPITSDSRLFHSFCALGKKLVALHLLQPNSSLIKTNFPVVGMNRVEKGYPQYILCTGQAKEQLYINKTQYIEGVSPQVWKFRMGGYQVLEKWLKDRLGRQLTSNEVQQYQQIIASIEQTLEMMQTMSQNICQWPIM